MVLGCSALFFSFLPTPEPLMPAPAPARASRAVVSGPVVQPVGAALALLRCSRSRRLSPPGVREVASFAPSRLPVGNASPGLMPCLSFSCVLLSYARSFLPFLELMSCASRFTWRCGFLMRLREKVSVTSSSSTVLLRQCQWF